MPLFRKEIRYFLPNVYPLSSFRHVLAEEFREELQCRCDIFMEPEMLRRQAPDPYQQLILTYLKFYLPSLFLVEDKISMVFSLESRTPLCDNELLDFALKIPLSLKLKDFELKHIPRRAMKGKLPEFIYRRPKRGFPTPFVIWFREELRDFIRCFILDHLSHLPMFDARSVEKMIHDFQHPAFSTPYDEIKAHRIWVLLNLIAYFKNQQTRYQDAA
jgi:asparagine synthase (glutamine-hydrolysing)